MVEVVNPRRDRLALGGLSLSLLMSSLDTSIANASLPILATAFGASFPQAQWIVLASLLAVTSLTVSAGRFGDVIGRRALLLVGITLFTTTSVMSAVAPTLGLLVAARAIQGVAAATLTALAIAIVGDLVPTAGAGRAMGQLAAASAIGTTVGPTIGSLLGAAHPTAIFLVNVPLGALAFALSRRYLPVVRPAADRAVSFDVAGTLLLALTLTAYALSMTVGRGRWGAINIELLVAALIGAAAFVVAETRATSPLVSIGLCTDRALCIGLAANGAVATVVMATMIVGPFYLSRGLALGPAAVGMVLSSGPAAAALTGVFAGRAVTRFGAWPTAVFGLAGMLVGAAALAILPLSSGVAGYVVPLVTLTAGYAFFQTANNTTVMATVGDTRRGVVAGLLGLSRNLGLITGASLMGAVFLHATGGADLSIARPTAVAAGMRITIAVAASLIALVISLFVRDLVRNPLTQKRK